MSNQIIVSAWPCVDKKGQSQQTVLEKCQTDGKYRATCVGPKSEADGIRIVEYVKSNPTLSGKYGDNVNIEAAKILNIELVEKWSEDWNNTVMTAGKNVLLDQSLAGSAYTVVGPYLGLISSVSYTGVPLAADTMASHSTWTEAGNANAPTWTGGVRKTASWSAASGGSKSMTQQSFAITSTGTVKGAFVVFHTSAVATIDNTSGTLLSAGLFGTGDRSVLSGDTLNVTWSLAL